MTSEEGLIGKLLAGRESVYPVDDQCQRTEGNLGRSAGGQCGKTC